MVQSLDIESFLVQSESHSIIDVRSPSEYTHAHIPGAISLPLFSDKERAVIGTAYKQAGREEAMLLGLEYYGRNMQRIISSLKEQTTNKHLLIHCWRGGMRSSVVAWMLDLFGYQVSTLKGGYKAYRKSVLKSFYQSKNILILGGKTGSGKTSVLKELIKLKVQAIDLEALAHHKGSAFGELGESAPPSQEQFENKLFFEFRKTDASKPVWLEDESQRIGSVNLPNPLWEQMRKASVMYLEIPFEKRLDHIADIYGNFKTEDLKNATLRIQKRLGGLETKNAIHHLENGDIRNAFSILLKYYDKFYDRATESRPKEKIEKIRFDELKPDFIASTLMSYSTVSI